MLRLVFINTEYFADYLTKRVSFQELYELLTGTSRYPEIMCADCIRLTRACTTCKHMQSKGTITASIRDWEDDKVFRDCVWFDEDDRIMCKYPITTEEMKSLTENSSGALKRLIHIIKELQRHPNSCDKVIKAMSKYKDQNDYLRRYSSINGAELKEVEECPVTNYIYPALAFKQSLSSDARICYDGTSTVAGGISLNQRLRRGIVGFNMKRLIQWFLTSPKIALADFRSFYQRFRLQKKQWNLCNFWWFENLDLSLEAVRYIATVLMFGIISVPRLTLAGLELIGNRYPEIARELNEQCYVDDLLVHEPTLKDCLDKKAVVTDRCSKHGLHMKGWAVSSLAPTPEIVEDDGSVSFLGLKFYTEDDEFGFKLPEIYRGGVKKKGRLEGLEIFKGKTASDLFEFYGGTMTYGDQLSRTLSYYDPTGLLSPLLMNFKHANREACLSVGNHFRAYLEAKGVMGVCEYMMEMNELKSYKYKRSKHPEGTEVFDIHAFSDSGEKAKQMTTYTTAEQADGSNSVSFLAARNYLANVTRTMAQEELDILAQMATTVLEMRTNLQGKVRKVYGYTDSKICLAWVKNRDLPLQKFHRSRVAAILRAFTDDDGVLQLYYIPSNKQPADIGTKGVVLAKQVSPDSVFFNGPSFLKQPLEVALGEKEIIHIDDPACLNDKRLHEDDSFRQGLVQKLRFHPNDDLLLRNERLREIEKLSQNFSQASYDRTKTMLDECGYVCNPLDMTFTKFTKTHHYVFVFLLKLLNKVARRNDSGRFRTILKNWQSNIQETVGFSYICQPDLGDYKCREKTSNELMELRNLILNCYYRRNLLGLSVAGMELWTAQLQNLQPDSSSTWPDKLAREIRQVKESFVTSDWYTELQAKESLALTSQASWDGEKAMRALRSWYRYPGMPIVLSNLKFLLNAPETLDERQVSLYLLKLVHLNMYIRAYASHEYIKGMIGLLKKVYNKILFESLAAHKLRLQCSFELSKSFEVDEINLTMQELKEWTRDGITFNELWHPFQNSEHVFERLQGRDLVDEIFPTEAVFAQAQLLTCDLFHRILSKEIKVLWSEARIAQHCIVKGDKFVSAWRARALTQTLDAARQELDEGDIPHRNLDPRWQSMIPVGDRDSPLIISLMMHIHHDAGLNPLNRVKHYSHRGVDYNRLKLYAHVYVPNAGLQLTRIMKSCMICRARDRKKYQAMMGGLHPERSIMHHGYLAVQIDQWGPLILRDDGRYKDLRGRTSTTKVWVLTIVCMATKHVTFRVLRSMETEELARHLTYLSCNYQAPRKIFTDSFASNVSVASKGQLDIRLRNLLHTHTCFKYEVCAVGSHEAIGLCESRNKILKKFLGNLTVDRTTPIYELESVLELAAAEINSVPLGVTLESDNPTLAIITPNMLIDRGNLKRTPVGPIRVPRGYSEVKGAMERRWEEIGNLIQTSVIPEMLDNHKYLYDKGTPLQEGDIVMFQKLSSNNFSQNWSLARVKEVKLSSDGKGRVVLLEYKRPRSGAKVYDPEYEAEDYVTDDTYRDSHDLVKLHPVITSLDVDLRRLYIEMHDSYADRLQLEADETEAPSLGAEVCNHFSGTARESCQICSLKRVSIETPIVADLLIFCRTTRSLRQELLRVTLQGDDSLLEDIASNMKTNLITDRRSKRVVAIGNKFMGNSDGWSCNVEALERAVVSRIMAVCPTMHIQPVCRLDEGDIAYFARDQIYVEVMGSDKVYLSTKVDIEEFVGYEFTYPSNPRSNRVARVPLIYKNLSQSFNMSPQTLCVNGPEECTFNLVPRLAGCTRACCCYFCCQERCPDVFDGIPWDENTCSGPENLSYARNTL